MSKEIMAKLFILDVTWQLVVLKMKKEPDLAYFFAKNLLKSIMENMG